MIARSQPKRCANPRARVTPVSYTHLEFCLVVAGAAPGGRQGPVLEDVLAEANRLIAAGMKQKAAAKEVALRYQLSANEIYRLLLAENRS